eukprot:5708229-Amphidinium_carterae.2
MSHDTKMRAKSEWCFRVHHTTYRNLWYFLCRFPRQTNSRLSFRSLTKLRSYKSPKVKDLVRKVSPMEPGTVWFKVSMGGDTCVSQYICLAIAMQILGRDPADVHISLR